MVHQKTKKSSIGTALTSQQLILKNPTTVKGLAKQIINASDGYISMSMSEKEYRDLIIYFAQHHGKKLFSCKEHGKLNPTIENRIGKKRVQLVDLMLTGYQIAMI